jgi:hypothetical protein
MPYSRDYAEFPLPAAGNAAILLRHGNCIIIQSIFLLPGRSTEQACTGYFSAIGKEYLPLPEQYRFLFYAADGKCRK